jgi:uncharacterized protein YjiS (DUF1127 family)
MPEKDNSVPLFSPFEIERQARINRSLVIQSYVRGTMRAFAEWFRTQLARGLAAQRRIYSDIRELQQFDDRMLADIGITTDRGLSSRGRSLRSTRKYHGTWGIGGLSCPLGCAAVMARICSNLA